MAQLWETWEKGVGENLWEKTRHQVQCLCVLVMFTSSTHKHLPLPLQTQKKWPSQEE